MYDIREIAAAAKEMSEKEMNRTNKKYSRMDIMMYLQGYEPTLKLEDAIFIVNKLLYENELITW